MAWLLIVIREWSLDGVAYMIRHSIYQSIRLWGVVLGLYQPVSLNTLSYLPVLLVFRNPLVCLL